MKIAHVNYVFDETIDDPDELLVRYATLTGWSEALNDAGASRVVVFQRFRRNARLTRNQVDYVFVGDGETARPRPWASLRHLHACVAREQTDLAHVNGLIFPIQTWWLRRTLPARTAIVVQDHATGDPIGSSRLPRLRSAVHRRTMQAADAFLFTAREQAEAWTTAGLPESRVFQVMEASTTMRPLPCDQARRITGVTGSPQLLWVGRLNANKDPLTILEGFERSLHQLPNAELTMVFGESDLLPRVQQRVQSSLGLASRVRLLGRVTHEEMTAHYSSADMFVLGSHHEGSGYALVEACACGVVPVVTSIPTFRVITADGTLGALWAPGDSAGFAKALVGVAHLDLNALRERIAQHFDRSLSWNAVGQHALKIYGNVVASRQAALAGPKDPPYSGRGPAF